jgi:general secretion pathway protein G
MNLRSAKFAATNGRGDTVKVVQSTSHRVLVSGQEPNRNGFTLIELVISITVMTILTLGVVPLVKMAVKRQKEQQLREALRTMRAAIDQFHREALVFPCNAQGANPTGRPPQLPTDPRIKVAITDCTLFGVDNPDRFPPDLETMVNGVNVIPTSATGNVGNPNVNATDVNNATLATKKKVYLRAIPIDPMTGKADWEFRSCYDPPDSDSWGGENVFDVRSKSKGTALNGEKYSDW